MPIFENSDGTDESVFSADERRSDGSGSYQSFDGVEGDGAPASQSRQDDDRSQRPNVGPRGRFRSGGRGREAGGGGFGASAAPRGRGKVQVLPEEGSLPPGDPFGDEGRDESSHGEGSFSGRGGPGRMGGGGRFRSSGPRPKGRPRRSGPPEGGGAPSGRSAPQQQGGALRRSPYGGLGFWERIQSGSALDAACADYFGDAQPLDLEEVFNLGDAQMAELAASMEMEWVPGTRERQLVLERCLRQAAENRTAIAVGGVLELFADGNGCLVWSRDRFQPVDWSPFIPRCLVRRYGLRRGQQLQVLATFPREGAPHLCALRLNQVMQRDPAAASKLPQFKDLTPFYPTERLLLESATVDAQLNLSMRIVDLVTPVGLGQRGLIVAPPRTGKTILLQAFANAVSANRPDAQVWILLIDERPEEVTDFRRMARGEVFASTFDETPDRHVRLAEMVIEMARRRVECGEHVVLLLDSITRLARAYNTVMPTSGRILTGGIDANALQGPKSFFGSARNIEGGGSLTILGTALVETGSRMDDVIFEEFKGTGNMELHLDRELADRRIYPAINVGRSGTRKEELLYHPDELPRIHLFRRAMVGLTSTEAVEMLIQRVKKTGNNVEFLMTLNRG
jgi:transcription termination factor Rho